MTAALREQRDLIQRLYAELGLLKSTRAKKSKAYRDLEARIGQESAKYDAMLVALDLPKE